jgi:hypothetical protein
MDNLLLAKGAPPEKKEIQKVYTMLSSDASQFRGKRSTDSDQPPERGRFAIGISGRFRSESVDCFGRIGWTVYVGIGGQIGSEYADMSAN